MRYRIGEFSRLSRVTVRALRYYDEIGLLKPVQVDQCTGYRYYSIDQLPRLNHIIMLKSIGLALDDIKNLLRNGMPADHVRQLLQVKRSEIQDRIDQDSGRLRRVDAWLSAINEDGVVPDVFIQLKKVAPVRVISKREIGTYDVTIDKLMDELHEVLGLPVNTQSVRETGPVMGIYYDDEFKEFDADIEIAIPICGDVVETRPGVQVITLPEADVITTVFEGMDENITKAYASMVAYAEDHKLELLTPSRELYMNYSREAPEKTLTEIQFPYRPAER